MKDAQGRVIYVGKAKNLRSRAGSYFHKTAAEDRRICDWIGEVADVDYLAADSEVDALLMEARLIKDIQPKHNHDLKDDKSFPYLQITTGEDFPRVNFTREPLDRGRQALRPVPAGQEPARGDPGPPADLQVPHLLAGHRGGRPPLAVVPPLPARTRSTSAPPRATCGSTARPTARDIRRLRLFLDGKKDVVLERDGGGDAGGEQGPPVREGRPAPRRDQGAPEPQPPRRPGQARPARGLLRRPAQGPEGAARRSSSLESMPRTIDGVDIAHLGGTETVGSLVTFIDGLPFKPGYRRYKIKSVHGRRRLRLDPRGRQPADPGPPGARRAVPRHLPDRRRQGPAQRGPRRLRGPEGRTRRP